MTRIGRLMGADIYADTPYSDHASKIGVALARALSPNSLWDYDAVQNAFRLRVDQATGTTPPSVVEMLLKIGFVPRLAGVRPQWMPKVGDTIEFVRPLLPHSQTVTITLQSQADVEVLDERWRS